MTAAWDGSEGRAWAEQAPRYERVSSRHWNRLLDQVDIAATDDVLDIGCGTGASTRAVARIALHGSALGVDLSAAMLDHARRTSADEGLTNVIYQQADAQVHPFPPDSYDVVVSAFGAMFFDDPEAAFANLHSALRPGGTLALLVWRELARNEWLTLIRNALAGGRTLPEPPVGVPGPFGLADPDDVRRILGRSGFTDLSIDPIDEPTEWADDVDDAFAFVSDIGVARGLLADLPDERRTAALADLRRALAEHATTDGVLLSSSAWLITATASA